MGTGLIYLLGWWQGLASLWELGTLRAQHPGGPGISGSGWAPSTALPEDVSGPESPPSDTQHPLLALPACGAPRLPGTAAQILFPQHQKPQWVFTKQT